LEYGPHIVEHPRTHELIALTQAGTYHIEMLDLNSPDLIEARRERWADHVMLEQTMARMKTSHHHDSFPFEIVSSYRDMAITNIPIFPFATEEQISSYERLIGRVR
jgi:hypothetical protein